MWKSIAAASLMAACLAAAGPGASAEEDGMAEGKGLLTAGRFGQAYAPGGPEYAAEYVVEGAPVAALHEPPITVECWVKLESKAEYNIIVASQPKSSATHWELYTHAGSGHPAVYLPGMTPPDTQAARDICDGQWHYLAAVIAADRVTLYVDGEMAADQAVAPGGGGSPASGPMTVGRLPGGGGGPYCDGVIDELRISRVARAITGAPTAPFAADADTIGLWRFDAIVEGIGFEDASGNGRHIKVESQAGTSLDEVDFASYAPGPSPLDSEAVPVDLQAGAARHAEAPPALVLDGVWQMAEEGVESARIAGGDWDDAIPARVPGSVHTALMEAGELPPLPEGKNQLLHREKSFRTWWMMTTFARPADLQGEWLRFAGVCSKMQVWLNGQYLGHHLGMFGGPDFHIAGLLQERNTLVVKLFPAREWQDDVVFNNVYGWHYCQVPSRGIWRSVRIEDTPPVDIAHPFVATRDAHGGELSLVVPLRGDNRGWAGTLTGTIEPENFDGPAYHFEKAVASAAGMEDVHLSLTVPEPRLWWPNGLGEQHLYRMKLSFTPKDGGRADYAETTFGIRTIEMAPFPEGKYRTLYNWTFVINGEPHFIKGNGWCTTDPAMDFSRERYDRMLSLARTQHIQMLRAWGSGMPELPVFYDLCDRYGIMVLQEWPTAWNSHDRQPYGALTETVHRCTLELRNHPSLAMYGGGNEIGNPFGPAIDMMGRLAHELDGTRAFHRTDPWGGSLHNYNCYWGDAPLDHNVTMEARFFGEFGLACMPNLESVMRYLPDDEKEVWPAPDDGSLWHHTPIFNTANDRQHLSLYSGMFMPDDTLAGFIVGSQLSQAVGLRHPLERARTRWPDCTGALYYKMNDNYPAASWSTADWYGVPKIGHYICMDAFAPLHAVVVWERLNTEGEALALPVWLLDDDDALKDSAWEVVVRAYGPELTEIARQTFPGEGSIDATRELGVFTLTAEQNQAAPLLTVVEVLQDGECVDRTFYWTNYEEKTGCLMTLPRTTLRLEKQPGRLVVTNTGDLPAVGVHFPCPEVSDRFLADDGYFWLDAGETRTVGVNLTDGVSAAAWNAGE